MLRHVQASPGVLAAEDTPASDDLYVSPTKLQRLYGMSADEGQVRAAMAIIHGFTNRPSLWPEIYEERLNIPSDRNQCILGVTPVVKILEATGRYGYGRRDRRALNQVNYDYLAATAVFGSPPQPVAIDVTQIDVYPPTGEVWLPTGFFLINYTELHIKYLAGYVEIPDRVNLAVADIITQMCARNVSTRVQYTVGRVSQRFDGTGFLSDTAKQLLQPFIVRALM